MGNLLLGVHTMTKLSFISVFVMLFMFSQTASAQSVSVKPLPGERHGQFHLGMGSGAINLGFDYLVKRESNVEAGAYLLFLGEKKKSVAGFDTTNRAGMFAVGATAKIHYVVGDFDTYFAPGFGLASLKYANPVTGSGASETTIGPIFRLGALYKLSERISAGMEYGLVYNFLNADVPDGSVSFSNLTMRFWF